MSSISDDYNFITWNFLSQEMAMRRRFCLSTALILVILSVLAGSEILLISGFCFGTGQWLSDRELVRIAIGYEIFNDPSIPNETAQKYFTENKDCCAVDLDFPETSSLFDRIFGFKNSWVRVTHKASDLQISHSPNDGEYYMALVGITRCGRVFKKSGLRVNSM